MHRLRTLNLPPHRGREFFLTVCVEPDPGPFDSFSVADDAEEWGMSVHFQPDRPYESHVEVARIDTTHGEPHFDRLYEPGQPKEWLGRDCTYEDARADLLSNWRTYADQFFRNHYSDES
jgi:hypothetical protein